MITKWRSSMKTLLTSQFQISVICHVLRIKDTPVCLITPEATYKDKLLLSHEQIRHPKCDKPFLSQGQMIGYDLQNICLSKCKNLCLISFVRNAA